MDIDGLVGVLADIASGAIAFECRDVSEPSALAAEIVNARVYSFLDGAPLEERRTRAVAMRRWLEPVTAEDHGALAAPAVEQVRREVWPAPRGLEELHDVLYTSGYLSDPHDIAPQWREWLQGLIGQGRAVRQPLGSGGALWFAAERTPLFAAVYPAAAPAEPSRLDDRDGCDPQEALTEILRLRLGILGPTSEQALARTMALPRAPVAAALAQLQHQGRVFCGHFTPGANELEWCDRANLGRIHRRSLSHSRRAIEPISAADFWRFLARWQHVHPEAKLRGAEAMTVLVGQLEGWEAPAAAWESELLPARLENYDPQWLDQLCQSGRCRWLRLRPAHGASSLPVRSTPIALASRRAIAHWRPPGEAVSESGLSVGAERVRQVLAVGGALFYDELVERSDLTPGVVEQGLGELVSVGLVSADGFAGLRGLLVPASEKRRFKGLSWGLETAGRWSLLGSPRGVTADPAGDDERLSYFAHKLLQRYGVVFRDLCARESALPPWGDLLPAFRRLEARGEVRGGRFVISRHGEQFAVPEAVAALHAVRGAADDGELVISAADPLNLAGILFPGARIPNLLGRWLVFRRGVPVAVGEREGELQALDDTRTIATTSEYPRRGGLP